MTDDNVETISETPNWGQRALENAIQALRWALGHGDLSADNRDRARDGLDALEG